MRKFMFMICFSLVTVTLFAFDNQRDIAAVTIASNIDQSEECSSWSSWKCSRCGRYNLEGVGGCAYCGKPRKG